MNQQDFAFRELPKRRTGRRLRWLSDASVWSIACFGVAAYVSLVSLFWMVELMIHRLGAQAVVRHVDNKPVLADTWEVLYFNFVTILTIRYGDLIPIGVGRVLAVVEAILGIAIIGVVVAALTAKFLSAPRDSIVFFALWLLLHRSAKVSTYFR